MPSFNGYQYEPLLSQNEARFIVLEPAKDSADPPICSIVQCERTNSLEYSAVSYAWGKPEFSETLEIDCDGDTSYLRVTPNVDDPLRRLRACSVRKYLWIDALCLNQADKDEKAQQIPLMGRIYEEARVVHIWLGKSDPMTGKVFEFIRKASRLPQAEKNELGRQIAKLMKKIFGGGDGMRALHYFLEFSKRPWFSRRWIIQEACLAQQAIVYCGSYSIPLSSLVLAAIRFQTLDMSDYPIKVMANLRRPSTKLTILELLWNFHEARCVDPKDRIAALFGLISEEHRFHLDYNAHWTKFYKQIVSGVLKNGNSDTRLQVLFHLFEFGAVSLPEDITYPSWVPDWTKSRRRVLPYYSWVRNPDTYEAYPISPGHSAKASVNFEDDALQINWAASNSRLRARQVIYATMFDSAPENGCKRAEGVLKILNELFPCTSRSILQLFTLSYLIEKIVEFRHSDRDQALDCPSFDAYIGSIIKGLPWPSNKARFDPLRKLASLLQEFCLFKLESVWLSSRAVEAYGIGTKEIQVGDILIPLWSPTLRPDRQSDLLSQEDRAIHMSTMLAVRHIGESHLQQLTHIPNYREQKMGRIIGSAVCVLVEHDRNHNGGPSVNAGTNSEDCTDREQQSSIRLI